MSENTKIWAEIHSSLNIWSWIERVCLNDKNNESATTTLDSEFTSRADNDWFCHQARHLKWVCYNDKSIVDLLTEFVNKQNKLYYMHVVDMNETSSATCV